MTCFTKQETMLLSFLINILQCYLRKENKAKNEGKGLKILTPKQSLQRLPIALAQVKAGITLKFIKIEMKSDKLFILCINQKKSLKKNTIT